MFKNYMKPKHNQKARSRTNSIVIKQINKLSSQANHIIQQIKEGGDPNLSIILTTKPPLKKKQSPLFKKSESPDKSCFVIPMHKMQCFDIQQKVRMEEQMNDLNLEKKYRSNSVVRKTPVLLKGGFPFNVKKVKGPRMNKSEHFDCFEENNRETLRIFSKGKTLSKFDSLDQNPHGFNPHCTTGCNFQVRQQIQSHQRGGEQHLSAVYTSLIGKGTKFGQSDRNLSQYELSTPGPAEYDIKRFGELIDRTYYVAPSKQTKEISQFKMMNYLRMRSQSYLPEIKTPIMNETFSRQAESVHVSDLFTDKYGQQLYPLCQNNFPKPGPSDYNSDLTCISQRVNKIKENKQIKQRIHSWLTCQGT